MRNKYLDLFYKPLRVVNEAIGNLFQMRMVRYGDLYPWQVNPFYGHAYQPNRVPDDAGEYLQPSNPRLMELLATYRTVDPRATRPRVWTDGKITDDQLANFRGQNAIQLQISGLNYNEINYALSYYALRRSRASDLLDTFNDDDLFGANVFTVDGRQVSRDLLDSVGEVDFIRRNVGLEPDDMSILDIGAGYGRLVHRLSEASGENVSVYATDGFATSSFLAEFYLKYRKAKRAKVVPLHEVEQFLATTKVTLATNVHSFSECTLDAIRWWIERLAQHRVPYFMLIPNRQDAPLGHCQTDIGEDIEEVLGEYGYHIHLREPRYADPAVQKYAVDPSQINLFMLK